MKRSCMVIMLLCCCDVYVNAMGKYRKAPPAPVGKFGEGSAHKPQLFEPVVELTVHGKPGAGTSLVSNRYFDGLGGSLKSGTIQAQKAQAAAKANAKKPPSQNNPAPKTTTFQQVKNSASQFMQEGITFVKQTGSKIKQQALELVSQKSSKSSQAKSSEIIQPKNKKNINGDRITDYADGAQKIVMADGTTKINFSNGNFCKISLDGNMEVFYAEKNVTITTNAKNYQTTARSLKSRKQIEILVEKISKDIDPSTSNATITFDVATKEAVNKPVKKWNKTWEPMDFGLFPSKKQTVIHDSGVMPWHQN
ncbi:MAG: hypothetical protein Q8Q60_03375 [Candidatus Chromulinivorax sp.]|nr:hypothetical protein [Candidatus Chromulinivorax sp.]